MKKIKRFFGAALLLFTVLFQAQTCRFLYSLEAHIGTDSSKPIVNNDLIALDITPKQVYSYSYKFI